MIRRKTRLVRPSKAFVPSHCSSKINKRYNHVNLLHLIRTDLSKIKDHTNDFPINIPESTLKGKYVSDIMELTTAPASNECAKLALNGKLTLQQLQELRKNATIHVPSIKFPDQSHVWKVHLLL